ncbi:hypothetical protein Areg01_89480 [Actinoplanes regularis]|nr:hypothetical protein Areg01_89480 [Actinoplanes regularis]
MTATGAIGCGAGVASTPDGSTGGGTVSIQSISGIAGVDIPGGPACGLALVGVFTGSAQPVDPPPSRLSFLGSPGTAFVALSPALHQAFFVGDGLTGNGSGELQRFTVPIGATTLWLGFQDGQNYTALPGYYADNTGSVSVSVGAGGLGGAPLYGGTPIDVISRNGRVTDGGCTAGFAVRRVTTGALYMVTAGHCRDLLNRLGRASGTANPVDIYPAGDRTTAYASIVTCGGSSAECLTTSRKPSDMMAWAPDSAVPTTQVLAGDRYLPVWGTRTPVSGDRVCWTGRGTGHEACAVIAGNSAKDRANRALLRAVRGPGYVMIRGDKIIHGDSGSLVYMYGGAGVYAVGLAVIGSPNEYSAMVPIRTVEDYLGVSVLTASA